MKSRLAVAGVLLFALLAAACGDDGTPKDVSSGQEPVDEQALHFQPDDADAFLLSSGESSVVVSADEEGDLVAWHADEAGQFESVPVGNPGDDRVLLLGATAMKSGFMVFGREMGTGSPVIRRSSTGRRWEQVAPKGLEEMGQLSGVAGVAGHLYAIGLPATGDQNRVGPSTQAFRMWASADGVNWRTFRLSRPNSWLTRVASSDGTLVALGTFKDSQVIWRSEDKGRTWQVVPLAIGDAISLVDLAVHGDTYVAVGREERSDGSRLVIVVSGDRGKAWQRAPIDESLAASMSEVWSVHARPDGFWIPGMLASGGPFDPSRCYEDIESCVNPPAEQPVVLSSPNGEAWKVLDASGLGSSVRLESTKLNMLPSGEALLLGADTTGLVVWRLGRKPTFPPATTLPSRVMPGEEG